MMNIKQLRAWLSEEITVPYADVLVDSGWPTERRVTRWIADGYGSLDDAVNTYLRHTNVNAEDADVRMVARYGAIKEAGWTADPHDPEMIQWQYERLTND